MIKTLQVPPIPGRDLAAGEGGGDIRGNVVSCSAAGATLAVVVTDNAG